MTGTVLASTSFSCESLPINWNGWKKLTFHEGVFVQAGSKYMIRTNIEPSTNYIVWRAYQSNVYPEGRIYLDGYFSDYFEASFRTYVADTPRDYSTALTVGDVNGKYGDQATLTATLTNAGNPLPNQTVQFSVNGNAAGSAVTNASGVAQLTHSLSLPPGSYAISASYAGATPYQSSTGSSQLAIEKRPVAVTANNVSRMYGDPDPAFTASYAGLASWDVPAVLGTIVFTTDASPASPVGTYQIHASGLSSDNYQISYHTGILTIQEAPLTVTVADASRQYGEANPTFTGTITGLRNGDNITATYTTAATPASDAGTYPITATLTDPANKLVNYTVTNTPGTLTVSKVPLTVTVADAARWVNEPNPPLTGMIDGLMAGDSITASYTTTAQTDSLPGDYPIEAGLQDPDNRLGNYDVSVIQGTLAIYMPPMPIFQAGDSMLAVTRDVLLPSVDQQGFAVRWTSSNADVLDPLTGAVHRPSYIQGDADVELQVSVDLNSTTYTAAYTLVVIKAEMTDAESVAFDKQALEIGYHLGDHAERVTEDINLPGYGANGSQIVWSSSLPSVIDPLTGSVTRPAYLEGDAHVVLEATLTKGAASTHKSFALTVLRKDVALERISFSKPDYTITVNGTAPVTVTAAYTNLETVDVSSQAHYTIENPAIATIGAEGVLTGVSEGRTVISAVYGGESASAEVIVERINVGYPSDAPPEQEPGPELYWEDNGGNTGKAVVRMEDLIDGLVPLVVPADAIRMSIATETLSRLLEVNPEAVLEIRTTAGSLALPVSLLEASGQRTYTIVIEKSELPGRAVSDPEMTVWGSPVRFEVWMTNENGESSRIDDFGRYVERTISISETASPPITATGVWWDERRGQFHFVPTRFETRNGVLTAVMMRPGASLYAVIDHPVRFADLANHWSKNDVELMASKKIVHGRSPGQFNPDDRITRAEMAVLLTRALGLGDTSSSAPFRDIQGQWFEHGVSTAYAAGLIRGDGNGDFRPNDSITREELAVMVDHAIAYTGVQIDREAFSPSVQDREAVSEWAREGVTKALAWGILQGDSSGMIRPKDPASRAEAAAMLARMLTLIQFMDRY